MINRGPSSASSLYWLAGNVKEPTHFSQRVGHRVPGVVVWSLSVVLVGVGNARHISI